MFNTQPPEMGITGHEAEVLERFGSDEAISKLLRRAFPGEKKAVSIRNVTYAIASFGGRLFPVTWPTTGGRRAVIQML
jgi:cytochrome c peroxidase